MKMFLKRQLVKFRQAKEKRMSYKIINSFSREQLDIYEIIMDKCKKFPDSIRYDGDTSKILILLDRMIITMDRNMVYIDNHRGFSNIWFTQQQFEFIKRKVDVEAHRFRRKLQWEIRQNLRNFLQMIKDDKL